MRIHVAIASTGRAEILVQAIDRLADQTRKPDGIVLSVVSAADVKGIERARETPHILLSEKGLPKQRNVALEFLRQRTDVVVYFDDDFVAANDYLEQVERLMTGDPSLVGLTGHLVDDGIHGDPIEFREAMLRLDVAKERPEGVCQPRKALYGCNMAIRMSAAEGLTFDENLPLYGWLEDVDMTYQLGLRGKLLSGPELTGIHLGTRQMRTPGKRLGYSQIANVIYLSRKGTIEPGLGPRLMAQNLLANSLKSLAKPSGIDRRGRLAGNMLAITDWMRGRLDPRKILRL